jgi:hypothetical protein
LRATRLAVVALVEAEKDVPPVVRRSGAVGGKDGFGHGFGL